VNTKVSILLDMIDMYIGTYLAIVEKMWGDVSFFGVPKVPTKCCEKWI